MKPPLVTVNSADYRIYQSASRLLRKELGAETPTALALIQFELSMRSSASIAKDYLDCIGHQIARLRKATFPRLARRAGRIAGLRPLPRIEPEPGQN